MLTVDIWEKQHEGDNAGFVAEGKVLRLLQFLMYLSMSRRSLFELMERFDISQRTAYRYLTLLRSAGIMIIKDGHKRFHISECPLCGKGHKTNNHYEERK